MIAEKKEMQFMFVDNQGTQHNITHEATEHGASSKWDYLFKDYSTGEIIGTGVINNSGNNLNTGNVNTGYTNIKTTIKSDIPKNTLNKLSDIPKKSCTTPRGKILEHGKSILAYQQRNDVPDVCNIQRRICNDGALGGNFQQKSCKTDIPYTYTRKEVVLYNEKKIDPLIQPNKNVPINKGGNFDTDGKINGYSDPDTIRDNNINTSLQAGEKTVGQSEMIKPNCISPRGGIVLNGQFVKAYRYKNGFVDYPCEVQIRTCMQGYLEGTYQNNTCSHRDISFEDFMGGYFDKEKPSMLRIIETLNKDIPENEVTIQKGFMWEMIGNLWN